jgi:IS5 family transposase
MNKSTELLLKLDEKQFRLNSFLNPNHKLVKLKKHIYWAELETELINAYNMPDFNLRRLVASFLLIKMYKHSLSEFLQEWLENPYYQFFTGDFYFQWKLQIDLEQLKQFSKLLNQDAHAYLEKYINTVENNLLLHSKTSKELIDLHTYITY